MFHLQQKLRRSCDVLSKFEIYVDEEVAGRQYFKNLVYQMGGKAIYKFEDFSFCEPWEYPRLQVERTLFSCFCHKCNQFNQFCPNLIFSFQLADSIEQMNEEDALRLLWIYGVITVSKDWVEECLYDGEVKPITGKLRPF